MTPLRLFALAALTTIGLSSCATTSYETDPNAPKGRPSATVKISTKQAAHWASGIGGKGTLRYRGRSYPIEVSAIGFGGNGIQSVQWTGKVYNLRRRSDFEGFYRGVRSGFTVGSGKPKSRLKGDNGVTIYLIGNAEGLANSNGIDRFQIKFVD